MRKLSLIGLAAALMLSVGCGDADEVDTPASPASPAAPATPSAPATPDTPAPPMETGQTGTPGAPKTPAGPTTPMPPAVAVVPVPVTPGAPAAGAVNIGKVVATPKLDLIETQYLPESAIAAIVVHPQSIMQAELVSPFVQQGPLQQFQEKLGIDPKTIQRVTFVTWAPEAMPATEEGAPEFPGESLPESCGQDEAETSEETETPAEPTTQEFEFGDDQEMAAPGSPMSQFQQLDNAPGIIIIRLSQTVELSDLKDPEGTTIADWEEADADGKTYHRTAEGRAIYQPDPQVLVAASKEEFLQEALAATGDSPLAATLEHTQLTHAISFVTNLEPYRDNVRMAAMMSGKISEESANNLQSATIHADVASGVALWVQLEAVDEATPKELLKAVEELLAAGRQQIPQLSQMASQGSPELETRIVGLLETFLTSTQLNTEDKIFTMNVALSQETIQAAVELAMIFKAMAEMGAPQGQPNFPPPGEPNEEAPEFPEFDKE